MCVCVWGGGGGGGGGEVYFFRVKFVLISFLHAFYLKIIVSDIFKCADLSEV